MLSTKRAVGCSGRDRVLLTALALVAASAAASVDYEIGPGDVLKVVVLGQAEMTGEFRVDPEGMINYPILGKIKASGHSALEVERKLTLLLADGYLRRPQVTVTVAEYASQKVFVTGEVSRPGAWALKADRSLLALLSELGPLGPNAGHEVIVIRPPAAGAAEAGTPAAPSAEGGEGEVPPEASSTTPATAAAAGPDAATALPFAVPGAEVFRISLLELQSGNPEKNLPLQAGDTVYVPRAAQVYVMGSVARPGALRYQEGMTVLQALTLAGGVTERGSAGRTKVIRIVGGKKVEKKVKPTDLVQPEDTLTVPERFF